VSSFNLLILRFRPFKAHFVSMKSESGGLIQNLIHSAASKPCNDHVLGCPIAAVAKENTWGVLILKLFELYINVF
jgi:hypothetical protein